MRLTMWAPHWHVLLFPFLFQARLKQVSVIIVWAASTLNTVLIYFLFLFLFFETEGQTEPMNTVL